MFGNNTKLPFEKGDGNSLKVHSIFETIQGEGPYSGRQAIFIRLSGCNLACTFCDTDFYDYKLLLITDILNKIKSFNQIKPLIVITGGEPLRQNISQLCALLIQNNYKIQLETNGTLYSNIPKEVELVCSPKISNGKYSLIRDDILKQAIAIKFLISSNNKSYSDILEVGQTKHNLPVYIQPMDEYNDEINHKNIILAQKISKKHGAILSLQIHKILNID
jgi:organic radical activating enzyme